MDHVWNLVPDSLSADKRRARVHCDASGITVDRIHPFVQPVTQPACSSKATPSRSRRR